MQGLVYFTYERRLEEKGMDRKNIYKLFYGAVLLLVIGFCVRVGADFYEYNEMTYSAPFYVFDRQGT